LVLGVIVNDTLLLHVQLWGRNLVWYAGISGIVYSIGKAITPTKKATPSVSATTNLFHDMDTLLHRICTQYTHYYPTHWIHRGWDYNSVYTQFKTNHFDSEVKLFIYELIALLLTPYILYVRLSPLSSEICEFCLLTKAKLSTRSTRTHARRAHTRTTINIVAVADDDTSSCSYSYCMRGLESYEPLAYERKKRLRNKASQIVFDIEDDGGDELTIAEYYYAITKKYALVAHIIALQDERDAIATYANANY